VNGGSALTLSAHAPSGLGTELAPASKNALPSAECPAGTTELAGCSGLLGAARGCSGLAAELRVLSEKSLLVARGQTGVVPRRALRLSNDFSLSARNSAAKSGRLADRGPAG
jgi:hypothetical protein